MKKPKYKIGDYVYFLTLEHGIQCREINGVQTRVGGKYVYYLQPARWEALEIDSGKGLHEEALFTSKEKLIKSL